MQGADLATANQMSKTISPAAGGPREQPIQWMVLGLTDRLAKIHVVAKLFLAPGLGTLETYALDLLPNCSVYIFFVLGVSLRTTASYSENIWCAAELIGRRHPKCDLPLTRMKLTRLKMLGPLVRIIQMMLLLTEENI